ncbi:MAG: discoidin domain-containing protein [Clostridia bacterium]|nr:discoidin domain-containing protein [Clostridia bacterium]
MRKKISLKKSLAAMLALVILIGTFAALPVTVSAAATIESCAPKGTDNVAVGSTVTLSKCSANRAGSQNSYEMPTENWSKAMLVDGKLGNGWSTDPYDKETDRNKPVTVTLQLPSASEISCIALFPNGCFPAKYTVSVSADGKAYTKVADGTCDVGKPTDPAIHSFATTTASYVQIHVTERSHTVTGDGALVQFGEIAVYGKASASMTTHRSAYELLVGDTDTIQPTFIGVGNDTPAVTYKSSDTSVATVDADGKITAKKLGKTTINVTCASLGLASEVSVSVVEKKFDFDKNILISIFWPPTPEYITDEQYKLIADAGVNWVLGAGEETLATPENQAKMLELCAKYGIGMTVSDGNFGRNLLGKSEAQIAEYVNKYKNVPGAYGFYILDEPFNANEFVPAYIALKKAAPDAYMHLNFLPGHAYSSQKQYYNQINDWATLCANSGYPLDYIMFDHYPFLLQPGAMARDTFMANMRTVHDAGLDNGVKTGLYIQTVRQDVAFRRPTDSEIRYEMYLSLAFGFKQLSFFTWFTPVNRSEPFSDGIISADGKPNAHYETIKTINHEILALGPTLVKCDALEIYLNGETWGQPSIPEDFFVQPADRKNYTVSFLRHQETGRNYLMVVNNNFSQKQTVKLTFDKAIASLSEVSRADGSLKALTMDGQNLTLELAAGDGMLIALPEGFDHYQPTNTENPAPNTNLAALPEASVSATTSQGANGYYIDLLTDGVRFSDGALMGWATNDRSEGQITLDLGAVRDVNRIDLYPSGDVFEYGRTFPADLTISISEDGKTYTPAAKLENCKITGDTGISVTFDTKKAQYVRIDIPKGRRAAAICEIEVYNDDGSLGEMQAIGQIIGEDIVVDYNTGDNIALNKTTYVSSAAPDAPYKQWGWSQSYINDGIAGDGNGYTSNVGRNPTPNGTEYVIIDFGDLFGLEKVKITPLGAFPEDYTLAVSIDGKNWTDFYQATGAASPSRALEVSPEGGSINARFLRFMGTKLRGGGVDGYLLQFSEIEAYGSPVCDKSVIEDAMTKYMEKIGDESAKEYTDAKAALEDATLTQSQANDFAEKLLALLPPEEETVPETDAPTEPVTNAPAEPVVTDGETNAPEMTTTEEHKAQGSSGKGCASAAALSVLALLPLCWTALKKRKQQ